MTIRTRCRVAERSAGDIPWPTKTHDRFRSELGRALARHASARKTFEALSPSQRREYTEWITEAKRDETRARRLAQAVEWLAEGKTRHWKYQSC